MIFSTHNIPYSQTGYFSNIVLDYLQGEEKLQPFYEWAPSVENLTKAIAKRQNYCCASREQLTHALKEQYRNIEITKEVEHNIHLLNDTHTFTITTAHQPNIFTGPLYFIYKILHAIKLATYCRQQFPQYNFVPVYYMGSEDADLDELGHIFLNGDKLRWQTSQIGAVGRMQVDNELLQLIQKIEAEIGVLPYSDDILSAVKKYYVPGNSIQYATLDFVNYLFGKYGLVIVIPDSTALKSLAVELFKDELLHQHSSKIVETTTQRLSSLGYKVQAQGRNINLFYLRDDGSRLRIEKKGDRWYVLDSDISFNESELITELNAFPEKFSPNVILRGLFQEMILPNIAFIGGGGELAYWLELKDVFQHYKVPYPMLVLRNSFLIVNKKIAYKWTKLGFTLTDLFKSRQGLQSEWVKWNSDHNIAVDSSLSAIEDLFNKLSDQVASVDTTLKGHVYALRKQFEKKIVAVGKKLLRAEKRNHADAMRQIETLKQFLFPANNLQERIDNLLFYYATLGSSFIDAVYEHSHILEQTFVIMEEV